MTLDNPQPDPPDCRYEGDIKGLLVSWVEEHREEWGLDKPVLKWRPTGGHMKGGAGELYTVPMMSHKDVIELVEKVVSRRITELWREEASVRPSGVR